MDLFTAISTRASAIRLSEPAPTDAQIEAILNAGIRAPDHGRLSPWRFVVLSGAERDVLAQALIDMRKRMSPDMPAAEAEREGLKATRAPTIIVVAAHTGTASKVPEVERLIAVGAATQNMFLAAHALGLGAMWKTGAAAYDASVKVALGLAPEDAIIAFLYLGTPVSKGIPRESRLDGCIVRR